MIAPLSMAGGEVSPPERRIFRPSPVDVRLASTPGQRCRSVEPRFTKNRSTNLKSACGRDPDSAPLAAITPVKRRSLKMGGVRPVAGHFAASSPSRTSAARAPSENRMEASERKRWTGWLWPRWLWPRPRSLCARLPRIAGGRRWLHPPASSGTWVSGLPGPWPAGCDRV